MCSRSSVRVASLLALVVASLVLAGCAAGDPRFTAEAPAGFWVGLWHGVISWVCLVIGLFSPDVAVYEVHNTGGWYDFGFLFGVMTAWGGGSHGVRWQTRRGRTEEWDEIATKVEAKVQRKIRAWAEAEPDEDWDAVGKRVEAKLKRKIRAWAEEDEAKPS